MLIGDIRVGQEIWARCNDKLLLSIFNRINGVRKFYIYLGDVATVNESIILDDGSIYNVNDSDIIHRKRDSKCSCVCPLCKEDIAFYSKSKFIRHVVPGTKVSCPLSLESVHEDADPEFYTYIRNEVVDWWNNFSQKNVGHPALARNEHDISAVTSSLCRKKIYLTEREAELIGSRLVVVNLSTNRSRDRTYTRHYFCGLCNGWHITSMQESVFLSRQIIRGAS